MSVIETNKVSTYAPQPTYGMTNVYASSNYGQGRVKVDQLKPITLGQINSFLLDAREAGSGTLDFSVGPPGKNLPHQVKNVGPNGQHIFQVDFLPEEPVDHELIVKLDGVHIPGSPYILQGPQIDVSSVTVSGEGLVLAKVGEQASFSINATRIPGTIMPKVTINGPNGTSCQSNIIMTDRGLYRVVWSPLAAGDHEIRVQFANREVPRSPFRSRVADPRQVIVECPTQANLGTTAYVKVDVSRAGVGKLVVVISVDGVNVPNTVHQDGPSQYRFSFKPTLPRAHEVMVQFNGEDVSGSPFLCYVSGGSQNVTLQDKQYLHMFGQPVEIEIDARSAGEGQLVAEVRSEHGGVPSDLVPSSQAKKIYILSFVPREPGDHFVTVTFNEENIPQSPMKVLVQGGFPSLGQQNHNYNSYTMQQRSEMTHQQPASLLQRHTELDSIHGQAPYSSIPPAMQRTETVVYQQAVPPAPTVVKEIVYQQIQPQQQQSPASSGSVQYEQYLLQQKETQSPRSQSLTRTITYQPQYETALANEPTYFEVNPHGLPLSDLHVRLLDPNGKDSPLNISRVGDKYRYDFTPRGTGKYKVSVEVDGAPLPGSPFTYFVQPSSGVRVTDVTESGVIGEEMYFLVDTSAAGNGDLDVEVTCDGIICPIKREPLGHGQYRYKYAPKQAGEHMIDVQFNYQTVPGCPIRTIVTDPYRSLERSTSVYGVQSSGSETLPRVSGVSGRGIHSFPVSQKTYFIIEMHGKNWRLSDIEVDVRAPNGELVPVKLYQDTNGEIRVEYQSPYVGRHLVDIFYKGQKIAGSPYYVEVFDPKKVGVEQMAKETYLHEQTEFEVVNDEAGSTDIECKVISPSGREIPARIINTSRGMKVKYTPEEPGTYFVHTYVGGMEIPGSPMTQVVRSHTLPRQNGKQEFREYKETMSRERGSDVVDYGRITVSGDGLYRAEQDKQAHFYIDTHGMDGTPEVTVEGPHSLAKCNVYQDGNFRFKCTYVPVETGTYNIHLRWFGEEISGSPFHPRVIDARKVRARGDWNSNLDKEQRIQLKVGEMKRLLFDVSEAGPGELRAEVRHVASGRTIPVSITEKDGFNYFVDFVPDQIGDYLININWTGLSIPNSPFRGYAVGQDVKLIAEATASKSHSSNAALGAGNTGAVGAVGAAGAASGTAGREYSSTTKKVYSSNAAGSADYSKVVLSGTGIKEGIAGHLAEFYIDGSKAADGIPSVVLKNSRLQHVPVQMQMVDHKTYKCTYLANEPGTYLMYVTWGDRDLLNSPYTVNVRDVDEAATLSSHGSHKQMSSSFQSAQQHSSQNHQQQVTPQVVPPVIPQVVPQVVHRVEPPVAPQIIPVQYQAPQPVISLTPQATANQQLQQQQQQQAAMKQAHYTQHVTRKTAKTINMSEKNANSSTSQHQSQGTVGENFQLMINAQSAAPGDLVARCTGPNQNAQCELVQKEKGMYALNVKPRESGEHHLSVTYEGEHIAGSPFNFTVKGPPPPDPSKVRVNGPGIEHGILANFQSRFFVETEGAGAGNLSIKMRGPRGGFQATMRRLSQSSRTIECTYNPMEVGLYVIHVKWSGVDVPGSPFHVHIFDTYYELDRFKSTGTLPTVMREQHILQVKEPMASYQTSAYQTNTIRTLKKSKKNKKNFLNGGPTYVVRSDLQHTSDPNYMVAGQGHAVAREIHPAHSHSGAVQGHAYHSSSSYQGGYNGGQKSSFVAHENGPQYASIVRR